MFEINIDLHYNRKYTFIKNCVVGKIEVLTDEEFDYLNENLIKDNEIIKRNKEFCGFENDTQKGVLYLSMGGDDGLFVDSEGYDYARYSSYISNARQIIQSLAPQENLTLLENKRRIGECDTDEVHFYINDYNHSVERIYYNPDSSAGGQFVSDTLTLEKLSQGIKDCKYLEEFWDYWSANAEQYCDDIDTHEFTAKVIELASPDCDFKGETKETLEKLKEWVAEQEAALNQEQGINME